MDKISRRKLVDRTHEEIKQLVSWKFLEQGPSWVTSWLGFELRWSNDDRGYLTIPLANVEPFAAKARQDLGAFSLARYFSATRIEHGIPIPPPIDALVAAFLKDELELPKNANGRPPNWGQDFILITMFRRLIEQEDLKPTFKPEQKGQRKRQGPSASEILHAALPKSGVPVIDVHSIERVWTNSSKQRWYDATYSTYLTSLLDDLDPIERV